MTKISIDMKDADKPSIRATAIRAAKDFIYHYSRTKDKSKHIVRHIKIDGVYYSVSVSFKEDVIRIKLFEQGNKSRIGYIGKDKKEGRYEELEDAFRFLSIYF